ncbi:hypothetical protein CP981_28915 [Streptomyces platensis]|uniref:Uncharacterized protein n=1 Tax=Streptomyces platensis TaxID=58346 RepID=A0AAE6NL61_STRPT|nr:hypothetical protein CP981_28915 [Streptomyces platensis]
MTDRSRSGRMRSASRRGGPAELAEPAVPEVLGRARPLRRRSDRTGPFRPTVVNGPRPLARYRRYDMSGSRTVPAGFPPL